MIDQEIEHSNVALLRAIDEAGSQQNLADILMVYSSNISAWKARTISMPYKHAAAIAEWSTTGITIDDLLPNKENSTKISLSNKTQSSRIKKIMTEILELSEDPTLKIALNISVSTAK